MDIIARFFDPFYVFARRRLGIRSKVVNEYLSRGAFARLDGRRIELSYPDDITQAPIRVVGYINRGYTAHAVAWVAKFNERRKIVRLTASHEQTAGEPSHVRTTRKDEGRRVASDTRKAACAVDAGRNGEKASRRLPRSVQVRS